MYHESTLALLFVLEGAALRPLSHPQLLVPPPLGPPLHQHSPILPTNK
jgi:hypothetical protein